MTPTTVGSVAVADRAVLRMNFAMPRRRCPGVQAPTITKAGVPAVAATPETGKALAASERDLAAHEGQSDGFGTRLGSDFFTCALRVQPDRLRRRPEPL